MSQDERKQTALEETQEISAYDLFILALTILSLFVVLVIYLPFVGRTENSIAYILDRLFSLIFLLDFLHLLYRAPDRKRYFKSEGWLDLAGGILFLPIFRLFRLARALRIIRTVRRMGGRVVLRQYRENVAESAFWTTALAAILLLTMTALLIVPIESQSPDAQITNPVDALWWSLVTATTVGYGDLTPVTSSGRFLASSLMTIGVAFVSILTSYVTSILYLAHGVRYARENEDLTVVSEKLEQIDQRLARLEQLLENRENHEPST